MIEAHLMKLRARDTVSADEERALREAVSETREFAADTLAIEAETELSASTLLLEGLMCRFKDMKGGERQITELHVAGDFADLHSFTLKRLDHHVLCMTPCRVAMVPHERLLRISEEFPHLARLLWFSTNLDAAIHREWEVSLGRRTAIARVAHLFCELHVRLGLVGLTDGASYALELTQTDMAECLGLTSVHVNRTLRELREQGVVKFRGGKVVISDMARLERIAEFNRAYLYLERRPR